MRRSPRYIVRLGVVLAAMLVVSACFQSRTVTLVHLKTERTVVPAGKTTNVLPYGPNEGPDGPSTRPVEVYKYELSADMDILGWVEALRSHTLLAEIYDCRIGPQAKTENKEDYFKRIHLSPVLADDTSGVDAHRIFLTFPLKVRSGFLSPREGLCAVIDYETMEYDKLKSNEVYLPLPVAATTP